MSDNSANLRIQVQAGDVEKLRDSLKDLKDEAEGTKDGLKSLTDASEDSSSGLDGTSTATSNATSGFASLKGGVQGVVGKLGKLAGPAGVLAAVGLGMGALINFTREATREMNQGLLDAIEDVSRGSEEATEEFESLENVMRNVRGATDLLKLGYDNLDEAATDATREFIENEAVLRSINGIVPNVKEKLQRLAVDGYRLLNEEASEANERLIQTEVAATRVAAAIQSLYAAFGAGEGAERDAVDFSAIAGSETARGLQEVLSTFEQLREETGSMSLDQGVLNQQYLRSINLARERGLITEVQETAIRSLQRNELVLTATQQAAGAVIEETNILNQRRRDDLAALSQETDNESSSVSRNSDELEKNYNLRALIEEQLRKEADALLRLGEIKAGQALKDEVDNNADKLAAIRATELEQLAEFERQRLAIVQAAQDEQQRQEEAAEALRASRILGAQNSIANSLTAVMTADAKKRKDVLKKSLGQELIQRGGALVATGIGNAIALNPKGALEIAGGVSMIAAGAKLSGGGGGGGGAGRGGARTAPRESAAPVTNNFTTTNASFGFVGDRRAATLELEQFNARATDRGI